MFSLYTINILNFFLIRHIFALIFVQYIGTMVLSIWLKKKTPQLFSKQTICHIIGMAHITSNAIISQTTFLLNPDNFVIYHSYYDYIWNHM